MIGFDPENLEVAENSEDLQEVSVKLVTPLEALPVELRNDILDFTVEINEMLSTATFGNLC